MHFANWSYTPVKVYHIIICINMPGFIPTQQLKNFPIECGEGILGKGTTATLLYIFWHVHLFSLNKAAVRLETKFLVILNVCEAKQEVSAFCMDVKGTEDKNYIYQYLVRLKYGLTYWTFIKIVSEHNFVLERSCPNHSQPLLCPLFRVCS